MDDILEIFFQECDEQLQELETGLSAIAAKCAEADTVNAVFRAVHSIKGGAASFGLQNLVRFSHVFENALDGVRSGRIHPDKEIIAVFLKSMDVLSDLVTEARGGEIVDACRIEESLSELRIVNGEVSSPLNDDLSDTRASEAITEEFCPVPFAFEPVAFDWGDESEMPSAVRKIVTFHPHDAMYGCGDDARNILVALTALAHDKGDTARSNARHKTCLRSTLFRQKLPTSPGASPCLIPSAKAKSGKRLTGSWIVAISLLRHPPIQSCLPPARSASPDHLAYIRSPSRTFPGKSPRPQQKNIFPPKNSLKRWPSLLQLLVRRTLLLFHPQQSLARQSLPLSGSISHVSTI
ncbi:Hpt domain-containing protein [Asaia prunellae]|uniref:Hpt domain-containing protein n=1 Tax=Asaia prunellae TaxID=610245 RepID=UPI000A8F9FDA|nr:Hpt domain-containing protein [Asaia prunellae]